MTQKRFRTLEYSLALTISIILFLLGAILGSTINEAKLASIYSLEQDLRVSALSTELLIELISDCKDIDNTVYTEEITEIGSRLTYMEGVYGFKSPEVRNLKSYYSLLLIRHWIINEKLQLICDSAKQDVFFFYSNFIPCADCEDQGRVLTYLNDGEQAFNVYSFEYEETNQAVAFLKQKYAIDPTRLPNIVINGTTYYGFQSKDVISERLGMK